MYYCSILNSMSVLSIYEGELLGVVDKLYFSENLKKLVELSVLSEDGIKLSLPAKNIHHVGKNAITIKNNQSTTIKTQENNQISPIGTKAYSLNGEFLGVIKEISFNEKFQTEDIILENDQILNISLLASIGKNAIIFYDKNSKVNIKNFTPKAISVETNSQTSNINQPEIPEIETTSQNENKVHAVCRS